MYWRNDIVKTYNPLPAGYESYRFSGTNAPKPLPVGLLQKGNIPADLTPWKEGIIHRGHLHHQRHLDFAHSIASRFQKAIL